MLPEANLITLPNRARIVTVPISTSEVTTVVLGVRAGARLESAKERGIAHYAEHLLFKGSRHYPRPRDIDEAVAEMGGYINAASSLEYTYYVMNVPKKFGETAVNLLADMVMFPRLPDAEFTEEKKVVFEEILRSKQDDDDYVSTLFDEMLYEHQPLGREIAGTVETVRKLTRDHLMNFVKKWYVANSTVMVVIGGGNFRSLSAKAAGVLRRHKAGPTPRWPAFKRNGRGVRTRWFSRDQELSTFMVGYPGVSSSSPLMTAQRVLDKVFGGDTSSRLHNRIREKEGLVYAIDTDSDFYTDAGHTATRTQSVADNASLVFSHILDEYRRIVIDPVTERELRQAKATLIGDLVGLPDDHEECALFYLRSLLLGGGFHQLTDARRSIEAVDLPTVRGLAQKLFGKQRYYLATVGPSPLRVIK